MKKYVLILNFQRAPINRGSPEYEKVCWHTDHFRRTIKKSCEQLNRYPSSV
ncbi:hypothetical protein Pan97_00840 [Bremerella volcania]|uniref:Uncharacterized protein n=1 Tax=Bremerella volcania TaxID=2527984 RepID=A0A518C1M6_9BACT|nr:hypothetical protein Pan97_00840 [Bremerella volcania]